MKRIIQRFLCLFYLLTLSFISDAAHSLNIPNKDLTIDIQPRSLFIPLDGKEQSLIVTNKSLDEVAYNLTLELSGSDLEHQLKIISNNCTILKPQATCQFSLKAIGEAVKPTSIQLIGEKITPVMVDVVIDKLKPGVRFEGGVIYQVNADGRSGKLCSIEDNHHMSYWGGYGLALNSLDEGDGFLNSKLVAELFEEDTDFAAGLCYYYQTDSLGQSPCSTSNCYEGWYLPSKEELRELWGNSTLAEGLVDGFSQDIYWSSTEFSGLQPYFAWGINFTSGNLIAEAKDQPHKVRCIRRFSI
ncbi:Lcl domain-containing protein [Legionella impletisoli]|uniref:Lcl C-terminal domain-containing protein n=1 Tax=Legionella impletisoli TaxID=343510 RepID=A0A917JNW7_9GAMM|nr:DUF1566 domain-containing protein [Legionella impletisoli]GGI79338.1 hypothetical protein GCM10007966_04860 [Legionella impletisoli]